MAQNGWFEHQEVDLLADAMTVPTMITLMQKIHTEALTDCVMASFAAKVAEAIIELNKLRQMALEVAAEAEKQPWDTKPRVLC